MIYIFRLKVNYDAQFRANPGYQLYGYLMSRLSSETVDELHGESQHLLTQYFTYDNKSMNGVWQISTFDERVANAVQNALSEVSGFKLDKWGTICEIESVEPSVIYSVAELNEMSYTLQHSQRVVIEFRSPTTFKQLGENVIFPTITLIMQSLWQRFNAYIPGIALNDDDAFDMLCRGMRIESYKLQSALYPIKEMQIRGFLGRITVKQSLPAPLAQVSGTLLKFAQYGGIGAKTSLGMGGVSVTALENNSK